MKKIVKKAYAKVNLALDVLQKREDGYHDVRMIMQNISIFDVLTFEVNESANERKISLSVNKDGIPTDDKNLVYKAVRFMFDMYDINADIDIYLEKNIPAEAGMAGGSTDCAAAIHAVNELFDLKLDMKTLMDIGVKLGADVPYCILGHTALSEGIGEILTPVNSLSDCYILVVKPPVGVSTKMVYTNLRVNELEHHPDIDGMILALNEKDVEKVSAHMENVLETVTARMYPEIERLKSIMKEQGALNAIMSGSGPTVFGIYTDEATANRAGEFIRRQNISDEIFVAVPV